MEHPGLPLPDFYDAAHARSVAYAPDHQRLFTAAQGFRREHGIAPATKDARNVHLLLIDVQKDFCFPEGSLYVAGRSGTGALDDNARIAEFVYRNLGTLTNVTATLDTHFAFQIFFASFWVDGDGQPLAPFREIAAEEIDRGEVRPNPSLSGWLANGDSGWLSKQVRFYCKQLEEAGKYRLYLWPPHCILGSVGHTLAGVVHEAQMFHSYVRGVQAWIEVKGDNPLTENYSVLSPEVLSRHDGGALAQRNTAFIEKLLAADAIIVAGQAASHCVKSSLEDLLVAIRERDAKLANKVHILADCMSSVTVPDGKGGFAADFTPFAEEALARFAEAGMRVVRSTDPIESWLS